MISSAVQETALGHIQETSLLSAQECTEIRTLLLELREMWVQRQPPAPFHTLGLATYLDVCDEEGRKEYYANARYPNLILSRCLGWLYKRIAARLTEMLNAKVKYRKHCALPGFHIFTGVPEKPAGIHLDVQHHQLEWAESDHADLVNTISFTLSIKLPRGAGLNVWPELPLDYPPEVTTRDTWVQHMATLPSDFHPYTEGTLVLHDGMLPHQMALGDVGPGAERITMQGHGVKCNGVWELYW